MWEEIGEGLKVEGRHIRGLRQTNGMSNKIKLSNILQSWMDTLCSEVTWDNIKKALEGPVVDAKAIAVNISKCNTCMCVHVYVKVVASLVIKFWSIMKERTALKWSSSCNKIIIIAIILKLF